MPKIPFSIKILPMCELLELQVVFLEQRVTTHRVDGIVAFASESATTIINGNI